MLTATVAVVPARGGSVSVPRKNVQEIADGCVLVQFPLARLINSKLVNWVIVSTEDREIRQAAEEWIDKDFVIKRPKALAEDVPTEAVVIHAVKEFEKKHRIHADPIVTIQCTTPFIQGEDVDNCLTMLHKNKLAQSVVSMREVKDPPEWMFVRQGDYVEPLIGELKGEDGVRQTLQTRWIPNGGIYVTRRKALFEHNAIIVQPTLVYPMNEYRSWDIDSYFDLEVARALYHWRHKTGLANEEAFK